MFSLKRLTEVCEFLRNLTISARGFKVIERLMGGLFVHRHFKAVVGHVWVIESLFYLKRTGYVLDLHQVTSVSKEVFARRWEPLERKQVLVDFQNKRGFSVIITSSDDKNDLWSARGYQRSHSCIYNYRNRFRLGNAMHGELDHACRSKVSAPDNLRVQMVNIFLTHCPLHDEIFQAQCSRRRVLESLAGRTSYDTS